MLGPVEGAGEGGSLALGLTTGVFEGGTDIPNGSPLVWQCSGEGMARNVGFYRPSLETGRGARRY